MGCIVDAANPIPTTAAFSFWVCLSEADKFTTQVRPKGTAASANTKVIFKQ